MSKTVTFTAEQRSKVATLVSDAKRDHSGVGPYLWDHMHIQEDVPQVPEDDADDQNSSGRAIQERMEECERLRRQEQDKYEESIKTSINEVNRIIEEEFHRMDCGFTAKHGVPDAAPGKISRAAYDVILTAMEDYIEVIRPSKREVDINVFVKSFLHNYIDRSPEKVATIEGVTRPDGSSVEFPIPPEIDDAIADTAAKLAGELADASDEAPGKLYYIDRSPEKMNPTKCHLFGTVECSDRRQYDYPLCLGCFMYGLKPDWSGYGTKKKWLEGFYAEGALRACPYSAQCEGNCILTARLWDERAVSNGMRCYSPAKYTSDPVPDAAPGKISRAAYDVVLDEFEKYIEFLQPPYLFTRAPLPGEKYDYGIAKSFVKCHLKGCVEDPTEKPQPSPSDTIDALMGNEKIIKALADIDEMKAKLYDEPAEKCEDHEDDETVYLDAKACKILNDAANRVYTAWAESAAAQPMVDPPLTIGGTFGKAIIKEIDKRWPNLELSMGSDDDWKKIRPMIVNVLKHHLIVDISDMKYETPGADQWSAEVLAEMAEKAKKAKEGAMRAWAAQNIVAALSTKPSLVRLYRAATVEAVKWDGSQEIEAFLKSWGCAIVRHLGDASYDSIVNKNISRPVYPGYYIKRLYDNSIEVTEPDRFEATMEPVEDEEQPDKQPAPDTEQTERVMVTVMVQDEGRSNAEHGYCYYIKNSDMRIAMDIARNDAVIIGREGFSWREDGKITYFPPEKIMNVQYEVKPYTDEDRKLEKYYRDKGETWGRA